MEFNRQTCIPVSLSAVKQLWYALYKLILVPGLEELKFFFLRGLNVEPFSVCLQRSSVLGSSVRSEVFTLVRIEILVL
jgi:hypothetical protein